ncbi:MAG TPA: hypothetical protein VNX40_11865 [Mucilaginibacter sp.]|nr:hypothetical protein [Mucilaginibacter sp.]
MDDQLDNDIKNRIREVFDNYEDPTADEGWLLLREKFPEEKAKRRAIAWLWWSAAALLLLFLGVGLWEFEKTGNPAKLTINNIHPKALHENVATQKATPILKNNGQPSILKNENNTISASIAKNNANHLKPAHRNPVSTPKFLPVNRDIDNKIAHVIKRKDSVRHHIVQPSVNQMAATVQANSNNLAANQPKPGSIKIVQPPTNQVAATVQTNTNNQAVNVSKTGSLKPAGDIPDKSKPMVNKTTAPAKSIASMFAEDNQPENKKIYGEKSVHFGVYAATYFNYAKGSGNQPNLGAGVTSEITLTPNLKLVTGITIAQNSLAFNSSTPASGVQFSPAAAGIAAGSAPASNLSQMAEFSTGQVNIASVPTYKNYNASLIGLDVPLNLKYEFNPKKNNFYVLAGFSSGTFINETYTYQYNYPALASPTLQQLKNETSHNSFNSFYVGKMLNFAFGVGYPLGKNRIVLEPFLKYPVQGLGSQDIKFGAGGVNLKFNFTTNKK